MKVLSTKKLTEAQKQPLIEAGMAVTDYDAISIHYLDVILPSEVDNALFTSQNAVRSIDFDKITIKNCFCVGERTKQLLEENGQNVIKTSDYGQELADFLVKNYKNDAFYFFCGNLRRDAIPETLKMAEMSLIEVKTYETRLNLVKFDQKWDRILFFSPSGVESYYNASLNNNRAITQQERNNSTLAICIGETTASEAKKYTSNVITAENTSVESVVYASIRIANK